MTRYGLAAILLAVGIVAAAVSGCGHTRGIARNSAPAPLEEKQDFRLNVARVYEQEGKYAKAETELRQLLADAPESVEVKHRLAISLIRQGRTDEGMPLLLEAMAQQPHNIDVLNDLGYAYLSSDDLEAAEAIFNKALQVDSTNARATNNLAIVVGYLGDTEQAYHLFRRNLSDSEALANVAYIHVQRGELDLAAARYSDALDHDPSMRAAADALVQIAVLRQDLSQRPDRTMLANATTDTSSTVETPTEDSDPTDQKIQLTGGYAVVPVSGEQDEAAITVE